jgi:hypothetical protein
MSSNDMDELLRAYDLLSPIDPEAERPKQLATALPTLERKVLGLLDNRKGNADQLLLRVGERLGERYALLDIVFLTKPIFSRPATAAQIAQLKECDVVLTALAD